MHRLRLSQRRYLLTNRKSGNQLGVTNRSHASTHSNVVQIEDLFMCCLTPLVQGIVAMVWPLGSTRDAEPHKLAGETKPLGKGGCGSVRIPLYI
jgi:hypothetical protein